MDGFGSTGLAAIARAGDRIMADYAARIAMSRFIPIALLFLGSCVSAEAQAIKCTAFLHNADGSWRSFENATVIGSHGQVAIEAGEIFRLGASRDKADIAKILDSLCR